ncbi:MULTISPECIES: PAAR domain-containing protein [unclassified Pseudomonas]|uniref:PAAR domain-containing protein n=1 Tax=unclassified Pseudomonas TaxID=196821 RepID=UPI00209834A2|nr:MULTISPECIES: PAAR domain-containing protein [unclassified Pseudomonas]MCO7520577.1 PAAR domain-containing protein [Pseudomonas sp. 1]MCO7539365.1 PAAR domain-containing protein [Pseudomonas sp. VA159-2]
MSQRMNILGKGQGLDGDLTSTGATCIAAQARGATHGRRWLLEGDRTTPCPQCGKEGTITAGESRWRQDGIPTAVDGTPVQCGCPAGSNYVLAPMSQQVAALTSPAHLPTSDSLRSNAPLQRQASARATSPMASAAPGGLEPGFHIVQRSTSFPQLLMQLFEVRGSLPAARLQRLNPTFAQGFKAGEIFVIGDPDITHACTREEAELMAAAQRARDALTEMNAQEADFMMRHQSEIAGLLADASLSMGVVQTMMARSLEELQGTLRGIEHLHQQQFTKHGHLKSPEFFSARKELFQKLDTQLKITFLNKHMDLGSHDSLRRDLGISSRSLVHHWSRAGGPGQIPGYSTHLDNLVKMSNYLKYGGSVGIILGGSSSLLKIQEACRAGETTACKKIRFAESGNFAGGLAGGTASSFFARQVLGAACLSFGPVSATVCVIAVTGATTLAGSMVGMAAGERSGEVLFESLYSE